MNPQEILKRTRNEISDHTGNYRDKKLKSLFMLFLSIGVIMLLLWSVTRIRYIFLVSAFISFILAILVFMAGGIGYLIESYKYHRNNIAKNKTCYSMSKYVLMICLATFSMIAVFLFGVVFPVYIIVFIVKNILNLVIS